MVLRVETHGVLSEEDRLRLSELHPGKLEILKDVLEVVSKRQDECLQKRWKFKKSTGEQIIIRDLFAKIAWWIAKFKEVGDMVAQKITLNDIETYRTMIEGLVRISELITRYAIFECIYLHGEYQAKKDLEVAMVHLYEAILTYLLKAEQYYTQGTLKRAIESIGQHSTTGINHLIAAIDERERLVGQWSDLIRQEGHIKVSESAQRMEDVFQSLQQPMIVKEYEKRNDEADEDGLDPVRLDISDCSRLTLELIDRLPAIIFIDALDECNPRKRHELFLFLEHLLEKANNVVKIFVTSREDSDIVHGFNKFPNIRIAAKDNDEDIRRFVTHQLDLAIRNRTLLHGHVSEKLRQYITRTLVDGAQGMFRWVSLQLQQLCDPSRMKTAEDIEDALMYLPQTLAELYQTIHTQITNSAGNSRVLAKNVINWLLCAQRPLSSAQLTNAASMHLNKPALNDQILDVCCNLVVFDSDSDTFKFAHLSVREFFELQPDYELSKINAYAARHCLELLVRQLSIRLQTSKEQAESRLFSKYAILYWASHYEKIDRQCRQ
ncbi:MAG: hypothetical protein Q9167_005901 [Letrouitia subvulpina]